MSTELEKRILSLDETELEVRESDDGQTILTGYPIVFNSLSENLGGFRELINPNAFDEQFASEHDIYILANHDTSAVLGREGNDTLELEKKQKGIKMTARPNTNTTDGSDVVARVKRKDIVGMSFGFYALDDEIKRKSNGDIVREITKGELVEVSPVTFPAYPATSISARAKERAEELQSDESYQTKPTAQESKEADELVRKIEQTIKAAENNAEINEEVSTCETQEQENKVNILELLKRKRQRLMNKN